MELRDEGSTRQQHFMFLCAGLIIQAVGFQLQLGAEIATESMLVFQNACTSIEDVMNIMQHRLTKQHVELLTHMKKSTQETWSALKPILAGTLRGMGWGCVTVTYLCGVFLASVVLALLLTVFTWKYCSNTPVHVHNRLHFDYTKPHPVAAVDLPSGDTIPRPLDTSKVAVELHATVILVLPESNHNQQLGMVQVTAHILSAEGKVVAKGSQPCMLRFKSALARHTKSMMLALPIVAGLASPEAQAVTLTRLLEWVEDHSPSSVGKRVEVHLMPRASRQISVGLPELYGAELHVSSHHVIDHKWIHVLFLWTIFGFTTILGFCIGPSMLATCQLSSTDEVSNVSINAAKNAEHDYSGTQEGKSGMQQSRK